MRHGASGEDVADGEGGAEDDRQTEQRVLLDLVRAEVAEFRQNRVKLLTVAAGLAHFRKLNPPPFKSTKVCAWEARQLSLSHTRAHRTHSKRLLRLCVCVTCAGERASGAQQRKALLSVIASAAVVVAVEWFHLFCVYNSHCVCE